MVGEPTKRSLVIVLGIIGMFAVFLMVIPSVRSSDTKSNQTGYYLVDILEERKELPEVQGIPIPPRATGEDAQDIYELRVTLLKGDLVYLEGQVEVTNPTGTNVLLGDQHQNRRGGAKKEDQSLEHEQCDARHTPHASASQRQICGRQRRRGHFLTQGSFGK